MQLAEVESLEIITIPGNVNMPTLKVSAALASVVVLTVLPALYVGKLTNRWSEPTELANAAERLPEFPKSFGEWECTEELKLPREAQELLQYRAYISRVYHNRETGRVANVIILVGRPGPIVRHPPEFCYDVRGNETVGESNVLPLQIGDTESTFRLTEFKRPDVIDSRFFVCTAWSAGGQFETSSNPRMRFGGEPFIYAIQVVVPFQNQHDREAAAASLKSFLSESLKAFAEMRQTSQ